MRSIVFFLFIASIAALNSCTSPVDVDTPRVRIASGSPGSHVPLPESLRVRNASVQIIVTESDVTTWLSTNDKSCIVTIDTTFNPPYHWISGLLTANYTAMPRVPSGLILFFNCDTIPAGSSRQLTGNSFRVYAAQRVGSVNRTDTLSADSLSAAISTTYNATQHEILDTLRFIIHDGRWGDPKVYGQVMLKIRY